MTRILTATIVAFFLCSGCALVGCTPNYDSKMDILNSPDWSTSDTGKLHKMINILSESSNLPYTWSSSTNPGVDYSVTTLRYYRGSNYHAKEFTLVKHDKVSGATVTTIAPALKNDGLGDS